MFKKNSESMNSESMNSESINGESTTILHNRLILQEHRGCLKVQ